MEIRLPGLGEGIEGGVVGTLRVKPGDTVREGTPLMEVESDKAAVDVPSPAAGTVETILVKERQQVKVGDVLMTLTDSEATPKEKPIAAEKPTISPPPKAEASPRVPSPAPSGKPSRYEFKLPPLGEGITSAKVLQVLVKPGETVTAEQALFEFDAEKVTATVPSPVAGKVLEINVGVNDEVKVGAVVAVIETSDVAAPLATPAESSPAPPSPPAEAKPAALSRPAPGGNGSPTRATTSDTAAIPAGPATRRLARELGIDLRQVRGTARGGRVTSDDVKAFVRNRVAQPAAAGAVESGLPPLPDFSKFGPIEKKPVSNLRQTIARNMTLSWRACPMVTQFDQADITDLESGRKRIVEGLAKGSPKVTMTVLAVKAVVSALKAFPHFNASYDMASGELILKQYYHIGIAVDTDRGLVVPVIRDADKKSIQDLARDVAVLADKARANKLAIEEMRGGTFTITNLGGIGGTAFSPIINYPEVAILGLARSSLQPLVREGKIEPRLVLPLCLTYDHRVIDGADGARFTTRLVQLFSDPIRLLMES